MNKNNLDFELQSRVRKYLEYTMTNQSNLEAESIILNKLTKTLKNEVLLDSYGKFIQKIDFFKNNFSNSSLQDIMLSLKELRLTPEEFLYYVSCYKLLLFLNYFICSKMILMITHYILLLKETLRKLELIQRMVKLKH